MYVRLVVARRWPENTSCGSAVRRANMFNCCTRYLNDGLAWGTYSQHFNIKWYLQTIIHHRANKQLNGMETYFRYSVGIATCHLRASWLWQQFCRCRVCSSNFQVKDTAGHEIYGKSSIPPYRRKYSWILRMDFRPTSLQTGVATD